MKEAIVAKDVKVSLHDVPIPTPAPDQVLIKVIFSGSNPKDWKFSHMGEPHNSGDDMAGIIEAVGENVTEFKKGDRVAAFHEMTTPHGSYAEYAIAWAYTTFHLPRKTSFEEVRDQDFLNVSWLITNSGRYYTLGSNDRSCRLVSRPWSSRAMEMRHSQALATDCLRWINCCGMNLSPTTITMIICLIDNKGAFAIKLAQASNIHPIIAVAGRGQSYVETLITRSKGDTIIDYRSGDKAVVSGIKSVLEKAGITEPEVKYAFDAVSEHNSYQNLSEILSRGSKISLLLSDKDFEEIPDYIRKIKTMVGIVHMDVSSPGFLGVAGLAGGKDFGFIFSRLFSRGLQEGWFTGHPYEVVPGGLNGVEQGLKNYKTGVNSATKYIFKIEDTM